MSARARIESLYTERCSEPSPINEHLPALRRYGELCRTITEFGVDRVRSTLAWLSASPSRLHCYDLKRWAEVDEVEQLAAAVGVEFEFFEADVRVSDIAATDLLFIDTFHDYEQLRCELWRHAKKVSRYIILHDTVVFGWCSEMGVLRQGLQPALLEFLEHHPEWRVIERFPNNHGLTVLGREGIGLALSSDESAAPSTKAVAHSFFERLEIRRRDQVIRVSEATRSEEFIFPAPPRIGVVIGSFAAVPYIHLQLEARRRLYPDIPLLVHDDDSAQTNEFVALCDSYGAEFQSNSERCQHFRGDVMAFIGGLLWARERKIDLLVKFSRRFVPLIDWTARLRDLAMDSQYPTYCSWSRTHGYGFRSECVGMAVAPWLAAGTLRELYDSLLLPHTPFVEGFVHDLARRVAMNNCEAARRYDSLVGSRPHDFNGYAVWPFMGYDRGAPFPTHLWRESSPPLRYYEQAAAWGLPYTAADFDDPEQGQGPGE